MKNPHQDFIDTLQTSLKDGSFVKLSLGQYKGNDAELKSIHVRKVIIKRAEMLGFTYRYKTRDITKNYIPEDGVQYISSALKEGFGGGVLYTTDFNLTLDKAKITKGAPTQKAPQSLDHDRAKNRLIEAGNAPYLHALKITDIKGEVYKNAQDKFRQINKYVEIMSPLVKEMGAKRLRKIIDIGSGKGYLTFALYDYLQQQNFNAEVIGVEYREDMVRLCNNIAKNSGFTGLYFERASAQDFDCGNADVIIALHACDTATDDAISKGIEAGAGIIVVAPCCHKQIRREIEAAKPRNDLDFVLAHGIYRERTAEMVTDSLRGLILEYHGYTVKIFEFISSEHTAKNIMIVATKVDAAPKRPEILEKINAAKAYFGIKSHYLEGSIV